jgi:hypothetical protein
LIINRIGYINLKYIRSVQPTVSLNEGGTLLFSCCKRLALVVKPNLSIVYTTRVIQDGANMQDNQDVALLRAVDSGIARIPSIIADTNVMQDALKQYTKVRVWAVVCKLLSYLALPDIGHLVTPTTPQRDWHKATG